MRSRLSLSITVVLSAVACSAPRIASKDGGITAGDSTDGNSSAELDASSADANSTGASNGANDDASPGDVDATSQAREGGATDGDASEVCVPGLVNAMRSTSEVMILLDKSASMRWDGCAAAGNPPQVGCPNAPMPPYDQPFDRWAPSVAAVKAATASWDDRLRFGLMIFPGDPLPGAAPPITVIGCQPGEVAIEPALHTAASVATELDAEVADGDSTPIPGTLRAAHDLFSSKTPSGGRYVILITDGAPNCTSDAVTAAMPEAAFTDSYAEVDALTADGIATYVIGYDTHYTADAVTVMDEMAKRGGTDQKTHREATSQSSLETALEAVFAQVSECSFDLEFAVTQPAKLSVLVDGKARAQAGDDGWQLKGDRTLELRGQACADLQDSKVPDPLEVRVECE